MKEIFIDFVMGYLAVMTVTGFAVMGIDKKRAIRNQWRIPEATLLLVAFLGGGAGSFLGMRIFHHKTKHTKFVVLLPVTAVIYVILGIYLISM